jgi:hypothetical protein
MVMIVIDDRVKEFMKLCIRTVGACVDTDARIDILTPADDALLEGHSSIILLVLVFVPDLLRQVLGQK